ncbi:D-alanyl-D-alanine carboxypeptidase [Keratinibaculum paraultunense]|nr:D-alanyl-D-alanine carboxypeptidase [Keratinibaculum paraultunense]
MVFFNLYSKKYLFLIYLIIYKRREEHLKKFFYFILLFLIFTYNISYAEELNLSGEGAILIDMDTGQILYSKNPHMKLHPASTTKIMTGILAIENGNMDDYVTIDDEIVKLTDGSHIALEPGERVKFEDLVNALLIESANDAALALAKHVSGSIDEFVKLMNKKAKEIGTLNTNFVNPNGLTAENHITTPYDLSLIAKYAMENEIFREIVKNYTYVIPVTNKKNEERYLKSANKLLYSTQKIDVDGKIVPIKYEGITGIKTGYTIAAQNCLVASAERGNQRLIAVVLKANGREVYSDIHKLFNYGFNNYEKVHIAHKGQFIKNIEVSNGTNPVVAGILKEDLTASIPKGNMNTIEKKIYLNDVIEAPLIDGQTLGKVEYYLNDQFLGEVDIISTLNIEKIPPLTLIQKIINKWYIIVIGILSIIQISSFRRKRLRKKKRNSVYRVH